jgi:hypothetical protein
MITVSSELVEHKVSDEAIILNVVIGYTIVGWLLDFQLVQIVLSVLLGLVFLGGFVFVLLIWASWDLVVNPWVESLHLDKWNFFTTRHYSAWLLHKDENLWLRQELFFGIPMTTSFAATVFDFVTGITAVLINIPVSIVLLVLVWQTKANSQSF